MKNILLKKTVLLSTILVLTACDSSSKPSKMVAAATDTTGSHTSHDMSSTAMASSSSSNSQPPYVTEYQQSMINMQEQMQSASKIANADIAFATGMMAHHQGAIDMATIQLKYGKDNQMRALAQAIIKTQQDEITQMQRWLSKHKNDKSLDPVTSIPQMGMKNHDSMMQGITAANPDVAFAKSMIPHHQGAIDMANVELKLGKDKSMLDLAKHIKSAQDPEIKQMQQWLESNGQK